MRYPLLVVLLISTIAIASGEVLNIPTNINAKGVVGKPSSFSINMTVNPIESHTPIDAVLVIDTSPSMNRWSDVIAGGYNYYVQLTKTGGWGSYIGTFELKRTSDVELVLQTPNDVYNTTVYYKAWLVNNSTGVWVTKWSGSWWKWNNDPAVVRWYNLSPGKYDIYAKVSGGGGKWINTTRIMIVELPPERITVAKNAAKFFVGLLSSYDRVGLVNFSANATILLHLTNDKALANSTIDGISTSIWYRFKKGGKFKTFVGSGTNISAGLIDAISELDKYGRTNAVKVIILLTDGWRNLGDDPVDWATVARSKGYRVYTIGIGGANMPELEEIASVGGGKCYYAKNGTELIEVYREIYRDVLTYAYNVTLKLEFNNPNIRFDHAVPNPTSVSGNVVTWHWNELKNNTSIAVWVNSTIAGNWTVAAGNLTYYDYYGSHSVQFKVNMNFSGNLIVKVIPSRKSITEGETVTIKVIANYPIDSSSVTISGSPVKINATNSNIAKYNLNTTTVIVSWTPLQKFVSGGQSYVNEKLTFDVTSNNGLRNSTSTVITVYNRTVNKPGRVLVSRVQNLYIVTYVDKTPPKDVGFKIEVDGKTIDYSNDSFILTYFRKNYTTWVLEITPQYKFTNNLTQNVTANVTFYNESGYYLNGTDFTINKTNVTFYPEILNAIELNNLTIRWNGSIGYPIPLYVGELIEINGKLINATNGSVIVNGLEIYTTNNGNISAIFIPNAAGEYTIEVNAINNTTTTLLLWKDVPVRIKPVTPS